MGIISRIFGKSESEPQPQPLKRKRAYAAVNQGRLFADFKASSSSADSELRTALDVLRDRSRDLSRNNEFAKRYFELIKTNVVGDTGFKLQVKAQDNGKLDLIGNQEIEDAFKYWSTLGNCTVCGKMTLNDVINVCVEGAYRDGEVFIVKHTGGVYHNNFALQVIEPDRVDTTLEKKLENGNQIKMGVELDSYQRVVAYHILDRHPNDGTYSSGGRKHTRIPAERVIHFMLATRAGQTRGEPRLASAMEALKHLDALREAQLVACRVGASKMGFFTSDGGDGFIADDEEDDVPIMSAEPATFHQLPTGVKFSSFDPQYPTEFEAFNRSILRGIASGLGVSYASLSGDLEGTSYSSIRQGALEERDNYKVAQRYVIDHLVKPIYNAWLGQFLRSGDTFLPYSKLVKFTMASEFRGRAWSWVDPQKEMNAAITGLKNGVISLQDVATQYGKDVEELLSQISKDRELAKQYQVDYALEPYCASFNSIDPTGHQSEVGNDRENQ